MRRWIMLLPLLAACGGYTEPGEVSCPPEGTTLGYYDFAAGFFAVHCNRCHSLAAEDRHGAPVAYVFDSYDQVLALEERIFIRAAADNTSMPPGPDDPPELERELLAEWLACGAPFEAP